MSICNYPTKYNFYLISCKSRATSVGSIVFSLEDPTEYNAKIRVDAINDAFKKAQSMCEATSMTMGKPLTIVDNVEAYDVSVDDNHESSRLYFRESTGGDMGSSSVQPGELKFSHNVEIVYEIV